MIESRCGILCNQCEYKEQVDCKGCINIAKPFWADVCPVKSCCENREHSNCVECSEFACEILNEFAYDEKQGDNGKRIEQCKLWLIK